MGPVVVMVDKMIPGQGIFLGTIHFESENDLTPLRRKNELRDLRSPQMMAAFQEQVSKKR